MQEEGRKGGQSNTMWEHNPPLLALKGATSQGVWDTSRRGKMPGKWFLEPPKRKAAMMPPWF